MSDFKYKIYQEVKIISNDRNLNDKTVKIVSRFYAQWEDNGPLNTHSYKVSGEGIISSLSFYEDQLKEIL